MTLTWICRIVFFPLWLFHAVVARGRFSLPAPSVPHDRNWAPCHAVVGIPLLIAFELLLCIHLESIYVIHSAAVNLKIVFLPLLAFELIILIDNFRMCKALLPGDDESMNDEAIWETLPHFWVAISMVFFVAATVFTLLKLCGDVGALGWWDLFINYGIAECFAFLVCTKWSNPTIHRSSLWHWRFNMEENALWRRTLVEKFSLDNPWRTKESRVPHGTGLWKHIRGHWNKFESNMDFILGNGGKIRFWEDAWLGHTPVKDQFSDFYNLSLRHNGAIADFYTSQGWNLSLRRNINDWEMERVGLLLQMLSNAVLDHNKMDSISWKSHSKGIFSVKSCYNMLGFSNSELWPWKKIWYNMAPLKVSCFAWIVAKEACLTENNLQKRGFKLCSRCPLCEEQFEDVTHLFFALQRYKPVMEHVLFNIWYVLDHAKPHFRIAEVLDQGGSMQESSKDLEHYVDDILDAIADLHNLKKKEKKEALVHYSNYLLFCRYNTFCGYPPEIVKKMPKKDLAEEVWRLQAALGEQAEITKLSQQEYERLQNEKVLCRVCFEGEISTVLLPCRHRVLCSTCCEKCKRCPICRVCIEERLPVYDV
uniref:RING-type domain-containing protein n=1 Tax=Nicotiana tabacum TaxID=4097 RepID=A0A1S4D068_TOBAC|nr:PREDICTED: uncharacterized protein LOC107824519 [Nicotiana tabacum]